MKYGDWVKVEKARREDGRVFALVTVFDCYAWGTDEALYHYEVYELCGYCGGKFWYQISKQYLYKAWAVKFFKATLAETE